MSIAKRILIGRPIASSDEDHQRLPKLIGLPVFSSDAISSTAYATQEILFVTAVGASSLALGLDKLVPISFVVAVLIFIVVFSYRQTIHAYPQGGGSYIVSRENLGRYPSLVSGRRCWSTTSSRSPSRCRPVLRRSPRSNRACSSTGCCCAPSRSA